MKAYADTVHIDFEDIGRKANNNDKTIDPDDMTYDPSGNGQN